jgi:hypothetical protein
MNESNQTAGLQPRAAWPAMNKPFFVGIGAQKAGTSWLAEYLDAHPQVGFSPFKELHYFDSVHRPDLCTLFNQKYSDRLKELAGRLGENPTREQIKRLRCLCLRMEMTWDARHYIDFFNLVAGDHHRVVGEITPSYSLLEAAGFRAVRELVPGAKFIFIMRDPVDRYWSALRYKETLVGTEKFDARAQALAELDNPKVTLRTDYKKTLTELLQVVPADEVCVLFYEHLMQPATHAAELRRLTDFLGIDFIPGNPDSRVNVSKPIDLGPAELAQIAAHFSEVYEYVAENHPTRIPGRWREHAQLTRNGQ